MGTRGTIQIKDTLEGRNVYCNIYKQYDSYLSGLGAELKDYFGDHKIVNGYRLGETEANYANGMGCLAAQVVAKFKDGIGGIYLEPQELRPEEYNYVLYKNENDMLNVQITGYDGLKEIYNGPLNEFNPEMEEEENEND